MAKEEILSSPTVTPPSFLELLSKDDEHGRKCDLSKVLDRMSFEMASEVCNALGSPEVSAAAISRTLQRLGFIVTEGAVRRCRRTCTCWKRA